MKSILPLILLASCAAPVEHTLQPGQKFVDGEFIGGRLRVETRRAVNEPPEIVLFQDGQGNDFTIYER